MLLYSLSLSTTLLLVGSPLSLGMSVFVGLTFVESPLVVVATDLTPASECSLGFHAMSPWVISMILSTFSAKYPISSLVG